MNNLTEREKEVLKLIAEGFTNVQIGEKLNISHRTVDAHRARIMAKLNINGLAGLVKYAIRNGLTTADELEVVVD